MLSWINKMFGTPPVNWNFFSSSEEFSSNVFWGHEIDGKISMKDLF